MKAQNPKFAKVLKNRKHNICLDCKCYEREGKTCYVCKIAKPIAEFRIRPDGYMQAYCFDCEPSVINKYQKLYKEKREQEKQELLNLRKEVEELRKIALTDR